MKRLLKEETIRIVLKRTFTSLFTVFIYTFYRGKAPKEMYSMGGSEPLIEAKVVVLGDTGFTSFCFM